MIEETNAGGMMTRDYIFGVHPEPRRRAGRRIAWRDSSASVYRYFADAIGSAFSASRKNLRDTRSVTNATGTTCFSADYYPYGQENDYDTSCSPTYKFAGYEYDSETANYYAMARYYSPRLGRFMSPDPLGGAVGNPQSLNRYSYVLNNPENLTDPLGLANFHPSYEPAFQYPFGTWDEFDFLNTEFTPVGVAGWQANCADPTVQDCGWSMGYFYGNQGFVGLFLSGMTSSVDVLPSPQLLPLSADNRRTTCSGMATFTAVGGKQAEGDGALYSKYPALAGGSIRGGTFGTVAVQDGFLGLTTRQLRTYGTEILVLPSNQGLISRYGGPTGQLSVSDYGDGNIQGPARRHR